MKPKIVSIGVYGFDEESFFQSLQDCGVDTFCDIRLRRGMRGSLYAFANAARLQQRLADLGIRYLHIKELAPSETTRAVQLQDDARTGTAKRQRVALSRAFQEAYHQQCLANFDSPAFIDSLGPNVRAVALFCVERDATACHRSLVIAQLVRDLGLDVEYLMS